MLQSKHELARKNYLLIVSCIVTCLTLVSFVASYTVYLESFRDWGGIGRVFAAMNAGCRIRCRFPAGGDGD